MDMKNQYEAIAQSVLDSVQSNFTPEHEYATANARSFKGLDLTFYEKTQSALEALGFVVAADAEDKTISSAGSIITFFRVMHHPETAATAAMFYVAPLKKGFVAFETLFSNNHFIADTNSPAGNSITSYPMIDTQHHSPTASLETMSKTHAKRVQTFLSKRAGVKVQPVSDFEAVVRAQNLQNRCKHDHLASIGWITLEYLEKQTKGNTEMASGIYTAIQNILKGGVSSSSPAEQALIVHFKYGSTNLDALFALEDKLEKAVEKVDGATYDGHEIAVDGSDGRLYIYGPDAEQLFAAVVSFLKKTPFMKGARIVKRFGPPEDGVREEEVFIGNEMSKSKSKSEPKTDAPLSPEADKFLADATAEFKTKQETLTRDWRFGTGKQWGFDQISGVFKLDLPDGAQFQADGQILGSYFEARGSWEWAWNNPHVTAEMARDSKRAKQVGERLGISYLVAPTVPVPKEEFASYLAAIGVKATDSMGVYRGKAGPVDV
ncbi:MAG: hypothetical protein EPO07_02585, partial [Verrucomicrobia bacterium]